MIISITLKKEFSPESDFFARSLRIEGRQVGDLMIEILADRVVLRFTKKEWEESCREYVDSILYNSGALIGMTTRNGDTILVVGTRYFEIEAV